MLRMEFLPGESNIPSASTNSSIGMNVFDICLDFSLFPFHFLSFEERLMDFLSNFSDGFGDFSFCLVEFVRILVLISYS
jgi:hypothetical protein